MQPSVSTLPTIYPLDNNEELIRLLGEITGESRDVVIQRLIDEEEALGTNVRRDLKRAGVVPHVWSDALVEFYRTTKSFLYETSVWNRAPLKLEMREWIGAFLSERAPGRSLRVLSFGDGLGFDSVFLAAAGHQVTYYEVSDECVHFAKQVFAANGQTVRIIQSADELQDEEFDAVISLDVLEHVPSPPDCVGMFSRWLKPGGWLIAHSPFFFTTWHRVTHLKSNRQYSGCKQLYRQHNLHPVDGRLFWDPIALEKSTEVPRSRKVTGVNLGAVLLGIGRYANAIHCAIAQSKAGSDRRWRDDLIQRRQSAKTV
jgi:SAM-dependent methyltransferase